MTWLVPLQPRGLWFTWCFYLALSVWLQARNSVLLCVPLPSTVKRFNLPLQPPAVHADHTQSSTSVVCLTPFASLAYLSWQSILQFLRKTTAQSLPQISLKTWSDLLRTLIELSSSKKVTALLNSYSIDYCWHFCVAYETQWVTAINCKQKQSNSN